jgi:spectinomycin phosphotransferase
VAGIGIGWLMRGAYNLRCRSKDINGIAEYMLEKPEIKDEDITRCLQDDFGLSVDKITFLPLGADLNTAVYRVTAGKDYFLKLRRGEFNEASVEVPKYLSSLGMKQVIPPLSNRAGQLWTGLPPFKVILYPYVEGHNGFEDKMSPLQWIEFGTALKRFHATEFPTSITAPIPQEKFSPRWRDTVRLFLKRIEVETFIEPVAIEMADFLKAKSRETLKLVKQSERLAQVLVRQHPEFILCHADIHGWNLLIDIHGALYMVDWDTLIFAPKERDLMFIGGALGNSGYTPKEEEALFYQGYGQTNIDQMAIAYYRYERIVEDVAVFCEQIFLSNEGGEDRKQALEYLKSSFLPDGTIARAYQSDKTSKEK